MTRDFTNLLALSLKYLALRPRSQKEIHDYISKKTPDQTIIAQVITKLTDLKLLDDAKFASWLIESRSRSRPRGKRLLIQELKNKGIDLSTFNFRLSTDDEIKLARQALAKKHKAWSRLSTKDYRLKASRYLASRGFSWSAIETVLRNGYNDDDVS